ncbi:MAG: arginine--tRNA ligase [Gammaproteobacteria bacterium]|nr:arginine--tRNA ligase [Gammaproteobacteria bacterium]MDP6732308.1 arginine--tRNA ligase [Gammaproteobacteria bacterium]
METLKQQLNSLIAATLSRVTGIKDSNANVITASKPEFGDYQANGIMACAKQLKLNPRELAGKVVAELEMTEHPMVARYEIAGPGFINIHLDDGSLLERANAILAKPLRLVPKTEVPQSIVVDYSSPNLAKEMHVGHLRGTIIGDSLVRVLERLGHNIIRQNHVGDWGTQFGILIAHMQEVTTEHGDLPQQLADLEEFYKAAKQHFDTDEQFAVTARNSVVKLQGGDPDYLAIWERFIEESLRHCEAVYAKLNVTLTRDDLDAESRYNSELGNIINALSEQGLLKESAGALCVFLPEFIGKDDEPLPVIIQKSDGGYLYSTTDLAAIKFRSSQLQADRSLYVVDARQSLHFQQVFAVARTAGLASEQLSLEHIAYGTMMGKDGRPFKTRSGDAAKLVELLDESVRRAFVLVSEKNPGLDETLRQEIAEKVGIAAVKYADLSKNRTSDYVFDWSSMLSFEGNTAPYLMYAYARIKSILKKQLGATANPHIACTTEAEERELLLKILQLPEIVNAVAKDCYPNQLCNYLYELAGSFMRFYEACPILKSEPQLKTSRLALSQLTAEALQQGLDLLGIDTLEQM